MSQADSKRRAGSVSSAALAESVQPDRPFGTIRRGRFEADAAAQAPRWTRVHCPVVMFASCLGWSFAVLVSIHEPLWRLDRRAS